MLDGMPLIDVHLHAPRLTTLKPACRQWAHDFGDNAVLERVYDDSGAIVPERFDEYLAGEGVDVALLLSGVPGIARNARAVAALCPDERAATLVPAGNATHVHNPKPEV
ncbi:hypothetical protein Acsp03_29740 [Actinomadura sp. NBRC 104412]|uniref:hypothetical protein n=1 Tax=Actinomadura sp. NBRC 104412 TaxID=3032203 RepID=UPI0024A3066D|nr:hypothetical protein [Actinomadura sp. NBRC 104412]GLZ05508.1 hypothetical protein Acsp03_29740 [Actinomadura sp. NBRC 104412]